MKRASAPCFVALAGSLLAASALAQITPTFSTDVFGIDGTVTRYASLTDAQNNTNAGATINIADRDVALYVVRSDPTYGNQNIIVGSWWYTTDPNNGAYSGWGNVRGNTGIGFNQLYDDDASTTSTLSMAFGNQVGPTWTTFTLSLTGTGADYPDDYARFSLFDNSNDQGIYHQYALNVTATGLNGTEVAGGIEATNHPTGVTGTFTGIFELNDVDAPANHGFYRFTLTLDMDNWAFANAGQLNGAFSDSYFAAVPEPATYAALMGVLVLGIVCVRRLRGRKP